MISDGRIFLLCFAQDPYSSYSPHRSHHPSVPTVKNVASTITFVAYSNIKH